MSQAKGRQECVDGPHLDSLPPALIPDTRRLDMIGAVRVKEGEGVEPVKDALPSFGSGESLEKFLKDQARCNHQLARFQRISQGSHLGLIRRTVSPQSQGPHAGVHEKTHRRDRSAL